MSDQGPPLPPAAADASEPSAETVAPAPPPVAPAAKPQRAAKAVKKSAKAAPGPSGRGPAKKAPPPIDEAAATTRGFLVIGITVLLGLLIFFLGMHKSDEPVVTTAPTTEAPFNVPTTDRNAPPVVTRPEQGTTVPAKPPVTKVPPEKIKVRVTNGVDPAKTIAGPAADLLKSQKYQIAGTGDLPPPPVAKSMVYYSGDFGDEAVAVAKVLGIPDTQVAVVGATPPAALNGADILVVIGKDKA